MSGVTCTTLSFVLICINSNTRSDISYDFYSKASLRSGGLLLCSSVCSFFCINYRTTRVCDCCVLHMLTLTPAHSHRTRAPNLLVIYYKYKQQRTLEDDGALALLCESGEDLGDFPLFLYNYFEANNKEQQLLRWAIQREVKQAPSMYTSRRRWRWRV